MKLKELFPNDSTSEQLVTGLYFDSRQVIAGSIFFAIYGVAQDGHDFLESACERNPQAVVVSDPKKVPRSYSGKVIVRPDTRKAMAEAAKQFFGDPSKKMSLIGVTGTNGKTTTVYMLEEIFKFLGEETGVMGTIDHHLKNHIWKSELTTPDVIGVFSRLSEFEKLGAKNAAMEISSHALSQGRVDGLLVDVGIWTNLTRDHLDYHRTEQEYFLAKELLFLNHIKASGFGLINNDSSALKNVRVGPKVQLLRFGQTRCDYSFSVSEQNLEGVRFKLTDRNSNSESFWLATPGLHNVYNAAGALAAANCLGHQLKDLVPSLEKFKGAPGRLQLVHKKPHVFIDYAHTPDALASSLKSLKDLSRPQQKIISVFGFGGDRDAGKRPLMLNEALRVSDLVVITSDNPRTEDPVLIIESAFSDDTRPLIGSKIKTVVDRRDGIHLALQMASSDDVILIAGKGHEDYQIIGKQIYPFSDHSVVKEYFG